MASLTILVTGGAGYIGSHTVRALRALDREVVVLDSLELGVAEAVLDAPLVVGDIRDRDLVGALCREYGVTQVVHFAAYKSVGESMVDPAKYWRNNVAGTVELIEACLEAGVANVVFSSSCSVYGTPAAVPVTESAPIQPESVYAETKAMIERVLRWYGTTNGLRAVSLRYFNAAGASFDARIGEDWTYSINLIPLAMKAALLGDRKLQVFGDDYDTPDGTCIRDYIHVDDLADAHIKALDYLADGGATTEVNLGTGVGSSVLDVINATNEITGLRVPYDVVDRRPGDPVTTYADPVFAGATLGLAGAVRARRDRAHGLRVAPLPALRLGRSPQTTSAAGCTWVERIRSSQPSNTATARGSWRNRWPAPSNRLSSASPWALTNWRASDTGTLSSSSPCITNIGRGANRRAEATGRNRRNSRDHSSTDSGKRRSWIAPISRACSRNRRGCSAQSSKSARGLSNPAADTRGSSAATQIAIDPPVLVPTRITLARLADRHEVRDGIAQVIDPPLQREVTLALPTATEVERHRHAAELARRPVHQLRKRASGAPRVEWADREPVAQDDTRPGHGITGRAGDVTRELQTVRTEPAVHSGHG